MAAFVLAKCRFPGSKVINSIIVVALLYQSNVIYIMQYIVMAKLHMIDTYWALILPSIASPMGLFLMRQSIGQVPDAMIEAAKVDGAGLFRICWQIVMPNQKPALMTLIIFAFQAAWNIQVGCCISGAVQDSPDSCYTGGFIRTCKSRRSNGGGCIHACSTYYSIHARTEAGYRDHGSFGHQGLTRKEWI